MNTAALRTVMGFSIRTRAGAAGRAAAGGSEVFPEVHSGVEALNLVGIAVEHLGLAVGDETGQPLLASLAPARMVHGRVHVGVEPVLVAGHRLPGVDRLLLDEAHPDD